MLAGRGRAGLRGWPRRHNTCRSIQREWRPRWRQQLAGLLPLKQPLALGASPRCAAAPHAGRGQPARHRHGHEAGHQPADGPPCTSRLYRAGHLPGNHAGAARRPGGRQVPVGVGAGGGQRVVGWWWRAGAACRDDGVPPWRPGHGGLAMAAWPWRPGHGGNYLPEAADACPDPDPPRRMLLPLLAGRARCLFSMWMQVGWARRARGGSTHTAEAHSRRTCTPKDGQLWTGTTICLFGRLHTVGLSSFTSKTVSHHASHHSHSSDHE